MSGGSIATAFTDPISVANKSNTLRNIVLPDTSRMVLYNQKQSIPNSATGTAERGATSLFDEVLKATPPALLSFLAKLSVVEGPAPNVDIVLSICLQTDTSDAQMAKPIVTQAASLTSELSGSNKLRPVKQNKDRQSAKRKAQERQEDDESSTVQSQALPRDAFRLRQIQKARIGTSSQTGSASYGSALSLSGDLSGTSG